MKALFTVFIFLIVLMPLHLSAQDARQDVIYLKNGTVYRGVITEQIINVSYKIELPGGSVVVVPVADVQKVTKESRAYTQEEWAGHRVRGRRSYGRYSEAEYKDKGGFFEAKFSIMYGGFGARLIGGYKINQFAMIGAGIGMEGIYNSVNTSSIDGNPSPYSGQYFPIFIHYSGDILKNKITPFYEVEVGYTLVSNVAMYSFNDEPGYYGGVYNATHGGPMGNAGFGVHMYLRRSLTLTLSANLNVQYAQTEVENYVQSGYGSNNIIATYSHATQLMPAIRIGIGFMK